MPDGRKKTGRFIKRGSSVLDKVALSDFSFEELREAEVVGHDNPDRSIIHTRYHAAETIEKIKVPERFEQDLLPEALRRPVIRPQDFTTEWEEERRRSKQRKSKEEEEFDYQSIAEMASRARASSFEDGEERAQGAESASESPQTAPTPAGETSPEHSFQNTVPPSVDPMASHQGEGEDGQERPSVKDYENVDLVSDAINTLSRGDTGAPMTADDPTAITAGRQEFIPQSTAESPIEADSPAPMDPEAAPAAEYRRKQQGPTQEELDAVMDEAKSRGYEQGFRQGEEKAEVAVRQQASDMFGKVTELVREFENLKVQILESAQDNFHELAQAVAEALIRREVKVDPKALADMIRRAIHESLGKDADRIKIKVHPDTFDRLKQLDIADLGESLVADPELQPGDFRLESNLSVVDGRIKKLVADLLEQADLDLFQQGEEDDGGEKAG